MSLPANIRIRAACLILAMAMAVASGILISGAHAQQAYPSDNDSSDNSDHEFAMNEGEGSYAPTFLQAPGANRPATFEVAQASYNEEIGGVEIGGVEISGEEISDEEIGNELAPDEQGQDEIAYPNPDAPTAGASGEELVEFFSGQADRLTKREGSGSTIKIALLLTALSLAPAVVLMTTCYVRVVVVLSLLRQAFGAQQLPPTQVLTALSLFITILVMAPVWNEIKKEAIDPYASSQEIDWDQAWERGVVPVRRFMSRQIEAAGNGNTIAMLYKYAPEGAGQIPKTYDEVPLNVLLPSFMISELKVAFLLGFQIYLPFLIVDLVVSSVTVSMGMLMLPPTMVSFPMKLILFVMVDGWALVVGMLLQSFAPYT